ncbi:flagellar biosynthesis/type III secretory pathway protein [Ketogulonicigenium robustum]|uniref:Flagellar biosynthesis/type III secretory pathway protein n=1 Tax=Ketogulonicigenium robustum TaxID=92947 RepID=A0A1W6P1W3_9RHOB|nr:hypothetical protein [Ketogulonicigenium robustum]ARO15424.1 flagellar biosynthesis/type III secretory pathway protein [Ketogulonicigenium robustum]
MTLRAIAFEAFDSEPESNTGPSPEYLAGYDAAMAEIEQSQTAARLRALDVTATALADHSFTHAEARRSVLAALSPLFQTIAQRLLPGLRAETLRLYLIDALETAAENTTTRGIAVQLAPEDYETLRAFAPQLPGHFTLAPAAAVPMGTIMLATGDGESCLDIETLLLQLQDLLTMTANLASDEAYPEGNHVRISA